MLPDHAPLLLTLVACHKCGSVLKPKVIMGRRGVSHVEYRCQNKETDCSYSITSNVMMTGEMKGLRADGTVVPL